MAQKHGWPDWLVKKLKKASAHADRRHILNSAMHSMRDANETADQAKTKRDNWIKKTMKEVDKLMKKGDADSLAEAAHKYGEVIHALSDETSPSHVGFQVWDEENANTHAEKEKSTEFTEAKLEETVKNIEKNGGAPPRVIPPELPPAPPRKQ